MSKSGKYYVVWTKSNIINNNNNIYYSFKEQIKSNKLGNNPRQH